VSWLDENELLFCNTEGKKPMHMKFHLKNLGLLDDADLELADLTIICGENNTGKTYATYAVYGFLHSWRRLLHSVLSSEIQPAIQSQDKRQLDLQQMFGGKINEYLTRLGELYEETLPKVFASQEDAFEKSHFRLSVDEQPQLTKGMFKRSISSNERLWVTFMKEENSHSLEIWVSDGELLQSPSSGLNELIADTIADIVFAPYLPKVHISSAERTGTAVFYKELDIARTRLLKALIHEIGSKKSKSDMRKLFRETDVSYAWPVENNIDFTRLLEYTDKKTSGLAKQHPEVLAAFSHMMGGTHKIIPNQGLVFEAKGAKQRHFTMNEVSSCVRALLDVGFRLRCEINPGDLLIIDEPELSLHPKNQRAFARLVARLIQANVKVFITTHSDYLVKELNTLMMLHQGTEHTRRVQQKHGYEDAELLNPERVRLYITEAKPSQDNSEPAGYTLRLAKIHPEHGIEVSTFDDTIQSMNAIQEELLYGGEL